MTDKLEVRGKWATPAVFTPRAQLPDRPGSSSRSQEPTNIFLGNPPRQPSRPPRGPDGFRFRCFSSARSDLPPFATLDLSHPRKSSNDVVLRRFQPPAQPQYDGQTFDTSFLIGSLKHRFEADSPTKNSIKLFLRPRS